MNRKRFTGILAPLFLLGKPQITIPVSLSALTGFLLFRGAFGPDWLITTAGVFLMSFASSAINQVQDAGIDSLMERTRGRPIPSGRVKPQTAWVVAVIAMASGFSLLWSVGPLPAWLSLITLLCYNAVYTPLKRVTAFAVIPGALVGALPPFIGWTAAGGSPLQLHILLVAFFFFVGQIPHFWLILLKYDTDYKKAGLPNLMMIISRRQVRIMTLGWIAATAMAAILLPLFGVMQTMPVKIATLLATLALLLYFSSWLKRDTSKNPSKAFMAINIFYLYMMAAIIADALNRP